MDFINLSEKSFLLSLVLLRIVGAVFGGLCVKGSFSSCQELAAGLASGVSECHLFPVASPDPSTRNSGLTTCMMCPKETGEYKCRPPDRVMHLESVEE